MPKSKRSSSTTIVLSRYFDKNVDLVAGMCSKCYLESGDDVKIIAVNKKFLKEVEKFKKLKRTKFLHDDYPCEGDCISRQTFENDTLKLPPATTNDDYALITGDTSRSRQMEPRINNCFHNNSACENEVRSLCANTENSLQPEEKVDNKKCFYDNIKIETHISNILHNFNDLNSLADSNSIILDNYKPRENNFDEHNDFFDVDSIPQQSYLKMKYCGSQYPTYSQNTLDIRDCSNYHNDSQFEDTINIKKSSNGCGNSNTRNNTIAQNFEDNGHNCNFQNNLEVSKTHHQSSHSRNIIMEETSILNNLDILNNADAKDNTETKNNLKISGKINFSKLEKSYNSQKPKWLNLNENSNMKTEANLQQLAISMKNENFNCNTIESPKTEIKSEIVKTDFEGIRRTINFAKLKIKKKEIIEKPSWVPPRSPHNLIEESLFHDPWSLLIATIFLNKTSCMCARPRVEEFLRDFSSPLDVLKECPTKLEKYFLDLGLHKKRAEQVWRMSYDYAYKNWRNPKELYGIGKYGEDAYRMFILGDLDIEPTDRFLRIYRDWAKMKQKEDMNKLCPDDE